MQTKDSTVTLFVAILLIVLLGVAAYFFFYTIPEGTVQGTQTDTTADQSAWQTYTAPGAEFSIQYPPTFRVNTGYLYQGLGPGAALSGVSFTIPAAMASGTNLSSDTYISVERGPDRAVCTGKDFLASVQLEETITENGVTYVVARASDAGAGNLYEEIVYILPDCYAIRYAIHSTNIANYPEGAVMTFDRDGLISLFDLIRHTFKGQVKG